MSVLKHFNNLLFVFFAFGLAPLRPGTFPLKIKFKSFFLPLIISLIWNVIIIGLQFNYNHPESFGRINKILTVASLSSGLAFNVSAILQCYFHSMEFQNLINQIEKIEKCFEMNFSERVTSSSFARRSRRKVLFMFSLAVVNDVVVIVVLEGFLGKFDAIMIGLLDFTTNFFSVAVIIHVVIYVDIVQMYLNVLNSIVKNSPIRWYSARKMEFLKKVKLMHMELWKMVMHINHFFSWSLLYFTIDFMVSLVYDLYKIFAVLQSGQSIIWASGIESEFN